MNPPALQPEQVPMPVCKYEILDGSPAGPPVFYAVIGQMVSFRIFCNIIYSLNYLYSKNEARSYLFLLLW